MSVRRLAFQRRASVAGSRTSVKPPLLVEPLGTPPRSRPVAQVGVFFAITYLVTWGCFAAGSLMGASGLTLAVILLGSFAPSLVAVALTGRREGPTGVRAMLGISHARSVQGSVATIAGCRDTRRFAG